MLIFVPKPMMIRQRFTQPFFAMAFFALTFSAGPSAVVAQDSNPATVCAACHGIDGNSSTSIWPKLAGQHAEYIARQTRMVRDGQRSVPEMLGIVATLTDEQIDAVAEYYSEQKIQPGVADEDLVSLGKKIYQTGIQERNVASCQACHGPVGGGNPLAQVPAIAGQHADYAESRLKRYRDLDTDDVADPYGVQMAIVADRLTDREIAALASYLEGLYDSRQVAAN